MNLLFKLSLGASLAANVILGWLAAYKAFPKQLGADQVTPAVLTVMRVANVSGSSEFPTNPDLTEPGSVAEALRNRRYPAWLVKMLTGRAIEEKYAFERWRSALKLGLPGAAAKVAELERLRRTEMAVLFPPEPEAEARLTAEADAAAERKRRLEFGDLPAVKVDAVKKLRGSLGNVSDDRLKTALVEILEPAEIEDYMRFRSNLAQRIQERLRNVEVDEQTYLSLYESERDLPSSSQTVDPPPAALARTYLEKFGDEKFLTMIHSFNMQVGASDVVYQEARLSPAKRVELFFQADAALREINVAPPETRSTLAHHSYEALLANAGLLDPSQIAKFGRSPLGKTLQRIAAGQL